MGEKDRVWQRGKETTMGARGWLVVVVGLLVTGSANAGWPWTKKDTKKEACPAPSYSRLNYWAPNAVRAAAHFHGSALNPYAPACAAEQITLTYPCPAVDPARLVAERDVLR
jgi:hypothetical protein